MKFKWLLLLLFMTGIAGAEAPPAPSAAVFMNQQQAPQGEGAIQGPIKKIYAIRVVYKGPDSDFMVVLSWNATDSLGDFEPAKEMPLENFDCKQYIQNSKKTLIIFGGYGTPQTVICK
jgi:hypothetical protein